MVDIVSSVTADASESSRPRRVLSRKSHAIVLSNESLQRANDELCLDSLYVFFTTFCFIIFSFLEHVLIRINRSRTNCCNELLLFAKTIVK